MFRRIMLGVAYLALPFLAYGCAKTNPTKQETTQPSGIEQVLEPEERTLTAEEIDRKIKDAVDAALLRASVDAEFDKMSLQGEINDLKRYIENMDKLRTRDAETARKIHKEIYHPDKPHKSYKPGLHDYPAPFVVTGIPEPHFVITTGAADNLALR